MVLRLMAAMSLVVASELEAQVPARAPTRSTVGKDVAAKRSVGWLGFRTDPDDAALIVEVAARSPAEGAGVRVGDRIIASDPLRLITQPGSIQDSPGTRTVVPARLYAGPVMGSTYQMTLRRGTETFTVTMIAGAPPKSSRPLLKPTRRAGSAAADTVEAEARVYRDELARTTLKPARKSPVTRASIPLRRDSIAMTHTDQGTIPVVVDQELYASLQRTLKETNRAVSLMASRTNAISGAEFEHLNPALGHYFGGIDDGVFVLRVAAGSPAASAGLEPGDIVESVNGLEIETIATLRETIANESGTIILSVIRKGKPATVTLRKE